jgi:hypothetical protein
MATKRKKSQKQQADPSSDDGGTPMRGRYADANGKEPILPALCHLSRKILGQLVKNEIFGNFDDDQRRTLVKEFRESGKECPEDDKNFLRFLTAREVEHLNLAMFVERLSVLKYDAHVLLSRKTASLAYRFLVAAIGALGPVPEQNRTTKRDEEYYRGQLLLLRSAVRAFVSIFRSDCHTAYFLNGRLNRVCSLFEDAREQDGLHFPEAITDCAWRLDDLPVQLLFDEGDNQIYPPFPTRGTGNPRVPETKRAFERREGVDPKRVLAFRLTWGLGRSRAAIILNWRAAGPDTAPRRRSDDENEAAVLEQNDNTEVWMNRIWAEVDAASELPPTAAPQRIRQTLGPLHLAFRYFAGWLSESHIDVSQQFGEQLKSAPHQLIRDAAQAAREPLPPPGGDATALIGLVRRVLDPDNKLSYKCHAHWVSKTNTAPSSRELVFQKGNYDGFAPQSSPAFDLDLGKDGLVKRSVCAQAAAWQVSLLVRDFVRTITSAGKTWRDLHVARLQHSRGVLQPIGCGSELAIPVFEGDSLHDRVSGVMSIEEAKGELRSEHLRHVELVVRLYQRLRAAHKSELVPEDRSVLASITEDDAISRSFPRLSREFCGWLLTALDADVAYLNVFDARVRAFRPVGVTVSEANARLFLEDEELLAHLGVSTSRSAAHGRDAQYLGHGSLLHGLIEHAVANRLLPRPDGLTDTIFRTKTPCIIAAAEHRHRFDEATEKYAAWLLGLPFAQATDSVSDGVLWIYWRKGHHPPPHFPSLEDHSTFCEAVTERVKLVTEAVAAMYAIHRYHDPDSIGELLPSSKPAERRRDRR